MAWPIWRRRRRSERGATRPPSTTMAAPNGLLSSYMPLLLLLPALVLTLMLGAVAVATPSELVEQPAWLSQATSPTAWFTITVLIASLVAAFVSYWWPRRLQPRPFVLVATIGLGTVAVVLSSSSYWGCADGQSAFWAPVTWTLNLFVGNAEMPFGSAKGCPSEPPLAFQVARLTALATTFVGIGAALALVFKEQWDRLRSRFARDVVVVSGSGDQAIELLAALRSNLPSRVTVIALFPRRDVGRVVASGARAVVSDRVDRRVLESVLVTRGTVRARALYLVSGEPGADLALLRVAESVLSKARKRAPVPPTVLLRLDDPWQSEDWRRRAVSSRTPWLSSAIGVLENTARVLVDYLQVKRVTTLLVVGHSDFGQALLSELAWSHRQFVHMSRAAGVELSDQVPPRVVGVVGRHADRGLADHAECQHWFARDPDLGAAGSAPPVTELADPSAELVLEMKRKIPSIDGVVFVDEPSDAVMHEAVRLSARERELIVLVRGAASGGVAAEPTIGELRTFGMTMVRPRWTPMAEADGQLLPPEDSWERLARLAHVTYGLQHPTGQLASIDWEDLDDFHRQDNLRLVHQTLRSMERLGFTWQVAEARPIGLSDLREDELEALAVMEHLSWVRHHEVWGWRYDPVRNDQKMRHPLLLSWDQLPAADPPDGQDRARSGAVGCLKLLRDLGYRPTKRWQTFERRGEVRATRLTEDLEWRTETGDPMQGNRGDWLVEEAGQRWTITESSFQVTYAPAGRDGRYRRIGEVIARPAAFDGEVVSTREGSATAHEGDWIVEDAAGDRWPVPSKRFVATYAELDVAAAAPRGK